MAAIVRIQGDSTDAREALAQTRNSVRQTAAALTGMRTAANGAMAPLGRLASAAAVFFAIRGMVRLAGAGVRAFAEESDEAREAVDRLAAAKRRFLVAVGSTLVGGENLDAVLGNLRRGMNSLTRVVEDNRDTFRSLVREGLSVLLRGGALAIDFFSGLAQVVRVANAGLNTTITTFRTIGETAASVFPPIIAYNALMGRELANPIETLGRGLTDLNAIGSETIDGMARQQDAADALAGTLRDLATQIADDTQHGDTFARMAFGLTTRVREVVDQAREGEGALRGMGRGASDAAQEIERAQAAIAAANAKGLVGLTQLKALERLTLQDAENKRKADIAAGLEADAAFAEQREQMEQARLERDRARQEAAAESLAQRQSEAQQRAQDIGNKVGSAFSAMAAGNEKAGKVALRVIGDELAALSMLEFARAAAAFASFNVPGGIAHTLAAGGALASSKLLGSSLASSGRGGAVGAPPTQQTVNVNVSQVNNGGGGGVNARQLAGAVTEAVRSGMLGAR